MKKLSVHFVAPAILALPFSMELDAQEKKPQEKESARVIEEVLVTAQFVTQDAQDIPIAVTALSGDMLDKRGQDNTAMIGAQAPSVQLQPGPSVQGNSLIAFIRGIGQQDNSPTLEPGVGIYVDDVYFNNVQGSVLDLLDIERVEILRGPQGTLAGKNSIGGAIKIYSKRPSEERDGYIEASYGEFSAKKLRGASNFTLVDDELFLRLSGRYFESDGYVQNYDFDCLYPGAGLEGSSRSDCEDGTLGGRESTGARAAVRWLATDSLEINFGVDYIDDQSEPAANILTAYSPTAAPIFGASGELQWPWLNPGAPVLPSPEDVPVLPSVIDPCVYITLDNANACPQQQLALGGPVINDGFSSFSAFRNPATGFSVPRENSMESQNVNLNMDWSISDDLQLQSISALRTYNISYSTDDDAAAPSLTTQSNLQDHTALSQEFRLNGTVGDAITYTVGTFYQETETTIGGMIDLTSTGLFFVVDDVVDTTSYAAFSNVIWGISERLELVAGLRYSNDEKTFNFARFNIDGSAPDACPIVDGIVQIIPGSNCLVGGLNDSPAQVFKDDRIDYRLALSFLATDDLTFYGSVATGYKAGGANSRPFFSQQLIPHESEELTSYELGAKLDLFDNSLRINTALFTNDYQNVLVTLFDCSSVAGEQFGSPCFLPANVGTAQVSGFELEFDWSVTENLYLDGSFSYIDFEYTEVAASITEDTRQPYTPETTWSLGGQYDVTFDFGLFATRVDVVYQDDIFTQPDNSPLSFIEAYTVVNASLRWYSPDESWVVGLEGKNLTDEYYFFNAYDQTPSGYAAANPALPRTWALSLRKNF